MINNYAPNTLERYELKFMISDQMIGPISDFVSIYCDFDKHAQMTEDGFYHVISLYLDSPNYLFLRNREENCDNRFNMRIRTYNNQDGLPCFFELKQKCGNIIRKYRTIIPDQDWQNVIECTKKDRTREAIDAVHIKSFQSMVKTYDARPKVLTDYKRMAFISNIDPYARVTFDKELRYLAEDKFNLAADENMLPYDNPTAFNPGCNIILELKCYASRVPQWMLDLIKHFDLRSQRFSKYAGSMMEVLSYSNGNLNRQSRPLFSNPWAGNLK